MFGGAVLDRAGNPSNQDEVTAEDFIAPTLTVTLTTAVSDRPVLRQNSEFTVTISSDEELRRLPTVWFAALSTEKGSNKDKQTAPLGSSQRGDRVAVGSEDNSWQQTFSTNDVGNDRRRLRGHRRRRGRQRQRRLDPAGATHCAPTRRRQPETTRPSSLTSSRPATCWWRSTRTRRGRPGLRAQPRGGRGRGRDGEPQPVRHHRLRHPGRDDGEIANQGEDNEYGSKFKGDSHSAVAIVVHHAERQQRCRTTCRRYRATSTRSACGTSKSARTN